MDLSSEKLMYSADILVASIDRIKDYMTSLRDQIKEQFRMTDINCKLTEKKENGLIEYYLEAWPHGIRVLITRSGSMNIWFANECEGVSHAGIREALKQTAYKIKNCDE